MAFTRVFRAYSTSAHKPPYSVLFFGTDDFSVITLKRLLERRDVVRHLEVVCPPDTPTKKVPKCPVSQLANSAALKLHHPPAKTLSGWKVPQAANTGHPFDIGVVVSFGYFLTKPVLASFPLRAVNVHPSVLPKYRGAAPIQHTILNNEHETGVSIIELHEDKFDAGRILRQAKISVPPDAHYLQLHNQLAELGAQELISTLEDFPRQADNAKAQDKALVSHAPKIEKAQARIVWSEMTAEHVYRLYRAVGAKIPLHTTFRGKRAQLTQLLNPSTIPSLCMMKFPDSILDPNAKPGTIIVHPNETEEDEYILYIKCSDAWIPCTRIHMQSKREIAIGQFDNGYQIVSGQEQFL
ncbi:methionyl-tRNA formyltransferase [Synchytrium endobioticum]|uniref:Methionyl-tRNA formyltransferase, mitochondrial n=1 Tax=Synchytrium endobioticum TaxID=286115 RepID=A0A507CNH8_9FUNG|nr:methionyl-tRNA formyltransferase [Synchytrium endobioticum]